MVIFDTNVLALYFSDSLSADDKLRVDGLIDELKKYKEPIGIPTPVLAELLSKPQPSESDGLRVIQESSAFKIIPHDAKAAYETAEFTRNVGRAESKEKSQRPRQAVKVDRQIIAIAKVTNARLLVSNDEEMRVEAAQFGVTSKSISDLEIPESKRQFPLELPKPAQ